VIDMPDFIKRIEKTTPVQHSTTDDTNVKKSAEDVLAKQINDIYKDLSKEVVNPNASLPPEKITPPTSEAPLTAEIAIRNFPNLAYEIVKLGLLQEGMIVDGKGGLNEISEKIEKLQEKSRAILELQQKLTKLAPEKKSFPVTEDIKAHLLNLKENFGIDLLEESAQEISVEKLASIKLTLDGQKSQLQTDTQKHFMDIQTKTQQYNSLLDSLKIVIKHSSALMSTITQNTGR